MSVTAEGQNTPPVGDENPTAPAGDDMVAPTAEWKQLAYEMAWTQYSHEDDLAQTRTNVSLSIQAAILALLAALAGPVLETGKQPLLGRTINVGVGLYSLLSILSAILALRLVHIWAGFAAAGQQYMNLRLETAFDLERDAGLSKLGPASREHLWKRERLTDELPTVHVAKARGHHMGGWASLLATTRALRALWITVLLSGCASLAWVLWGAD